MTSQLKTVMLLALLSAIIIILGGLLGGRTGVIFAFGLALIMNVGSYWFSDKIVLSMYNARELAPEEAPYLHQIVEELAARAGITAPITCGIMPFMSKNQVSRMIFMCGASLPSPIIRLLNRYEGDDEALRRAGIEYAAA